MSLVEGIGDEVIQFFGVLFVTLLGFVAWWSTGIRDRPQIRTVLILEHRSSGETNSTETERTNTGQGGGADVNEDPVNSQDRSAHGPTRESNSENIECTNSSDISGTNVASKTFIVLDKKRLGSVSGTNSEERNSESEGNNPSQTSQSDITDNIRIRLKYLNDDQKLVEGRLQELLGDFKRRHFSMELSADKLVRLIFNGQVLQSDDQTLQGYGLYDNCVVHCLVHNQLTTNVNRTNAQHQSNGPPPEWNLGSLLHACIGLILGVAWFCRYNYSQLFTMTTTATLAGLTGMFAVSMIGLYMPDHEPVSTN